MSPNHLDYDHHLISLSHIFGVNQPVSWWVGYEPESMNLRPMRRNQLWQRLDTVTDIARLRQSDLITYTEDREPLFDLRPLGPRLRHDRDAARAPRRFGRRQGLLPRAHKGNPSPASRESLRFQAKRLRSDEVRHCARPPAPSYGSRAALPT